MFVGWGMRVTRGGRMMMLILEQFGVPDTILLKSFYD
jgi:hypothetical protein